MPPASPLSQATSSVTRLLKDLDSYDKELADQKTSLENLQADTTTTGGAEGDDDDEAGNREYLVKQQVGSVSPYFLSYFYIYMAAFSRCLVLSTIFSGSRDFMSMKKER